MSGACPVVRLAWEQYMSDPTAFRKRNGQRVEPAADLRPHTRVDGGSATLRRWTVEPCLDCRQAFDVWASVFFEALDERGRRRRCRWLELARCDDCRAARRAAKGAT